MSLEENKSIVRRLYEAFNRQTLALLDELMATDFVEHALQLRGLKDFKQFATKFYKSFPDFHITIEDITAEADKVWARVTYALIHRGEYRGLAPTGKKITFTTVQIWRIVDGKVVDREGVYDLMDCYKQLGVIEYKGFPDEAK